jgi:hypothetical protein
MRSKALAIGAAACIACAPPPERLQMNGRTLVLFNDTRSEWRGVEIWVNDHYRVTRDRISAGERFVVPLDTFVAGLGQRFTHTQPVNGIEVTATDESGARVRIVWGQGRRR